MSDFEYEIVDLDPSTLIRSITNFAPLAERQGVFVHSFKCMECSLEFALFTWFSDRHAVSTTACPECRSVTRKIHWLSKLSDSREMVLDGSTYEIFHVSPFGPEPLLQRDSSPFDQLSAEDPAPPSPAAGT